MREVNWEGALHLTNYFSRNPSPSPVFPVKQTTTEPVVRLSSTLLQVSDKGACKRQGEATPEWDA